MNVEQDMALRKRQYASAIYFLVWHAGMTVPDAEDAVEIDSSSIEPLARAGDFEFIRATEALCRLIDKMPPTKARRCSPSE